jgi:hypothetical protein
MPETNYKASHKSQDAADDNRHHAQPQHFVSTNTNKGDECLNDVDCI